jgi:hypothetical protein
MKTKAFLTTPFSKSIRSTNPAATPIIHKHTPNRCKTQLGGLKLGFIKVGYQVSDCRVVTVPENNQSQDRLQQQ